jgi:biopolymer transport protein ExbD
MRVATNYARPLPQHVSPAWSVRGTPGSDGFRLAPPRLYAPPLDPDLSLVSTGDVHGTEPPDGLILTASGEVEFRGPSVDPGHFVEDLAADAGATLRVVPDRDAPAEKLAALARDLSDGGAGRVVVVTQRALAMTIRALPVVLATVASLGLHGVLLSQTVQPEPTLVEGGAINAVALLGNSLE